MKKALLLSAAIAVIFSCGIQRKPQNLPKDISLKPSPERVASTDKEAISKLKRQIDSLSGTVTCENAADWRISALGSKPCGGPASYITYPIKLEAEILQKIKEYNAQQLEYNRKNKIVSDCAIVPMPTGIRCENGKAVLTGSSPATY